MQVYYVRTLHTISPLQSSFPLIKWVPVPIYWHSSSSSSPVNYSIFTLENVGQKRIVRNLIKNKVNMLRRERAAAAGMAGELGECHGLETAQEFHSLFLSLPHNKTIFLSCRSIISSLYLGKISKSSSEAQNIISIGFITLKIISSLFIIQTMRVKYFNLHANKWLFPSLWIIGHSSSWVDEEE